jgi:hypothetical protein
MDCSQKEALLPLEVAQCIWPHLHQPCNVIGNYLHVTEFCTHTHTHTHTHTWFWCNSDIYCTIHISRIPHLRYVWVMPRVTASRLGNVRRILSLRRPENLSHLKSEVCVCVSRLCFDSTNGLKPRVLLRKSTKNVVQKNKYLIRCQKIHTHLRLV